MVFKYREGKEPVFFASRLMKIANQTANVQKVLRETKRAKIDIEKEAERIIAEKGVRLETNKESALAVTTRSKSKLGKGLATTTDLPLGLNAARKEYRFVGTKSGFRHVKGYSSFYDLPLLYDVLRCH